MSTPQPVDAKVEVTVSPDRNSAFMHLLPPANGGRELSVEDIMAALKEKRVVFGIRTDMLERLAHAPKYNMEFEVARGLAPVPGKDAILNFQFPTSRDRKPASLPNGSVDFKNLGLIHNVRKDDVLVIKTPPVLGTPGKNVFGEDVPPKPGREVCMPVGRNTRFSEDKLMLLASCDGQVDLMGAKVHVLDCLEVNGDVGPATGNITVVGNVRVQGDVLTGYEIHSEGNIDIQGIVEGGSLFAVGNVFVSGGFNGMGKGVIEAGGDVRCKYLQNVEITAEGIVESNTIINCTIRSGSSIYARGRNSAIMTSHLMARHNIECFNCGARNSQIRTTLEVGTDPFLMARSQAIPAELEACHRNIDSIERTIDLFTKLKAQRRLTPDKAASLKELLVSIELEREKMVELQIEKNEISERIMATGYGNVNVQGTAYPGVVILIGPEKKLITSEYKFSLFSRTETGIDVSPAVPH